LLCLWNRICCFLTGSNEEYIKDFVRRRQKDGSTIAVFIARGMMKTPVIGKECLYIYNATFFMQLISFLSHVKGWNVFNGARITDAHEAATALQRAKASNQILAGAGFSMGAIIVANYVARYGSECQLDAAISVSGGLNMREQLSFYRSMRLWQPMLAQELRLTILGGFQKRYRERLTDDEYLDFSRSSHISVSFIWIHYLLTLLYQNISTHSHSS